MAVVGAFLIGCALVVVVGCSGDTGSQLTGSQRSEDSRSAEAGSERTIPRVSESTVAISEQGGSRESSESTHEVGEHGGSQANEVGDSAHEKVLYVSRGFSEKSPNYEDSYLKVDGITYDSASYPGYLKDKALGPLFAEVDRRSAGSTTQDQSASNEVPIYSVKGYDTSFRVAIRTDYGPLLYEVLSNPRAKQGSDILDIGGKVIGSIGISHDIARGVPPPPVGSIDNPNKVERMVQSLMDAPIKPTS